ncbi:MAG: o-succinylbenzoate--CoA ligase [Marmoricola sp.]|nr:o-succinylbenzoate--CoA ligase [Marmoricola sp.]
MSNADVTVRDRYSDEEISSFYEQGYWEDGSLFDLVAQQAAAFGDKPFIFDSTRSISFAELHESGARLALGLRRLGVVRGDRVAVQLPNWAEFALIAVAINRAGGVLVPIMPIYREDEVGFVLGHSGAKVAITCEQFKGFGYLDMFETLAAGAPALEHVVSVRASAGQPGTPLESLIVLDGTLAEVEAELGSDRGPDEGLLVVYTSGTTSRPKGCLHTLNTLRATVASMALSLDYTENDVQFGPSPIAHSTGIITSFMLPLLKGASSHLMEAWEPVEGMSRIKEHGCTVAVSATAFLQMMMGVHDPEKHDVGGMRVWVCAGAPIPGSVVEKAREMLSGGKVLSLYGRSENFLTTMCTVGDDPTRAIESDGSALRGAQVQIVDVDGNAVGPGEEGDIAYKGPSHMLEYYHDPDQTAALFTAEGYSRSGDLGRMTADGYVRVTGRLKDIVIRGGMNISAREIEDLLSELPSIANVAVVGMPDELLGERVCVYVVPSTPGASLTLDEVVAYLRSRKVATQKLPERLEIIEALPLTATGKVQKHLLRADIAQKVR